MINPLSKRNSLLSDGDGRGDETKPGGSLAGLGCSDVVTNVSAPQLVYLEGWNHLRPKSAVNQS